MCFPKASGVMDGSVPVYFEAAAVIITVLVLLGTGSGTYGRERKQAAQSSALLNLVTQNRTAAQC
jgi:hypothetical protein